ELKPHPFRAPVRVQPNAQLIGPEERPLRDDDPHHCEDREATIAHQPSPARVQQNRVREHDEKRAILLGIPSPESPPRLIRPNARAIAEEPPNAKPTKKRSATDKH